MGEWGGERTGGAPPSGQARGVGGGGVVWVETGVGSGDR